jgi:hypothetical protein
MVRTQPLPASLAYGRFSFPLSLVSFSFFDSEDHRLLSYNGRPHSNQGLDEASAPWPFETCCRAFWISFAPSRAPPSHFLPSFSNLDRADLLRSSENPCLLLL